MDRKLQDKRYQSAARKIHDALAALLEQKQTANTADITIQELCEKAGVTRGTFYRHYKSIAAVVAEAEQYLFNEYIKILYGESLKIVGNNKAYFRLVFASSDYNLMLEIFRITKPLLQESWKCFDFPTNENTLDKMYHFCAYGMIGLVKYWVMEKDCDSGLIEEYTDFILKLAHKGMDSFTSNLPV